MPTFTGTQIPNDPNRRIQNIAQQQFGNNSFRIGPSQGPVQDTGPTFVGTQISNDPAQRLPGRTNRIFDQDIRDIKRSGEGIIDSAQSLTSQGKDEALGFIQSGRDQLLNDLPLDPFSDAVREAQFMQIQDQIQRQVSDAQKLAKAGAASRGVIGGSQAADQQTQLQIAGLGFTSEADVGLRVEQERLNNMFNLQRQGLLNPMTLASGELAGRFGALGGQLELGNLDILGDSFTAQEGRNNAEEMRRIAEINASNAGIQNLFNLLGPLTGLAAPGAEAFTAAAHSLGQPLSGLFEQNIFTGQPNYANFGLA